VLWSVASKAAERSSRQRQDNFCDSLALMRWLWTYSRAVSVEWCLQEADWLSKVISKSTFYSTAWSAILATAWLLVSPWTAWYFFLLRPSKIIMIDLGSDSWLFQKKQNVRYFLNFCAILAFLAFVILLSVMRLRIVQETHWPTNFVHSTRPSSMLCAVIV